MSPISQNPRTGALMRPLRQRHAVMLAALLLLGALAPLSSPRAQARGELLYATHCIACHTAQIHWRDKKLATDWDSLKAQVRRWDEAASLRWNDDDVLEVTRYLNESFYGFPPPTGPVGVMGPAVDEGRAGLRRK